MKSACWSSSPVGHSAGRAADHNVIYATPGPLRFANRQYGSVVDSRMLFLRQPLMYTICKWTNGEEEELVYNREWKTVKLKSLRN